MRFKLLIILILFCLISNNAFANNNALKDNFFSIELVKKSVALELVGKAKFSFLFWDIYQSQLQTSTGDFPVDAEKDSVLYEIQYLVDITQENLLESTVEQWQHVGISANVYQKYITELSAIWPDISEGDTLALFVQADHSRFYFNGEYIGKIVESAFAADFLAIWLSEKTSEPKLRQQLLGEVNDE